MEQEGSVMYGSAVHLSILRLSRGKVSHIYIYIYIYVGRCTTIHNASLQVLFSSGVSQNKEGYNVTVFNEYDSLLPLSYL